MKPSEQNKCSWIQERIDVFLDGELSHTEQATFNEHVEQCDLCAHELQEEETVLTSLRSLPELECPPHITERVLAAADPQNVVELKPRRLPWIMRPALAVAAVAAIALIVVFASQTEQPGDAYTQEEIARAEDDLKRTFAYVSDVSQYASSVAGREAQQAVGRSMKSVIKTKPVPIPQTDGGMI